MILSLVFLMLVLVGCQSGNVAMMDDVSDIKTISISKAEVYGKITGEQLRTFERVEELDVFRKAFMHAEREKMDLEGVNYDLITTDDQGEAINLIQFYLADEGERSAFFFIGHEDKVYFTSEEITHELRELIQP